MHIAESTARCYKKECHMWDSNPFATPTKNQKTTPAPPYGTLPYHNHHTIQLRPKIVNIHIRTHIDRRSPHHPHKPSSPIKIIHRKMCHPPPKTPQTIPSHNPPFPPPINKEKLPLQSCKIYPQFPHHEHSLRHPKNTTSPPHSQPTPHNPPQFSQRPPLQPLESPTKHTFPP